MKEANELLAVELLGLNIHVDVIKANVKLLQIELNKREQCKKIV